jgi:hypothetical protein
MKKALLIALALSLFIALFMSIIIMLRFRKKLYSAEKSGPEDEYIEVIPEEEKEINFESDYFSKTPEIENDSPGESDDKLYDYDFSFDDETSFSDKALPDKQISDTVLDEDEYITIELLGEIEEDENAEPENKAETISPGSKIIASVILDEEMVKNQNIPDAIPVKKEI